MLFYIILTVLFASAHAHNIYDCGSNWAKVEAAGIRGCTHDYGNCVLERGTDATLTIYFTPLVYVRTVSTEVFAIVFDIFTFPLLNTNSCYDHISCPLKAGEQATYSITVPVKNSYTSGSGDIKWILKDGDGDTLVCLKIPGKVK